MANVATKKPKLPKAKAVRDSSVLQTARRKHESILMDTFSVDVLEAEVPVVDKSSQSVTEIDSTEAELPLHRKK